MSTQPSWTVPASLASKRTTNPIRQIVDTMKVKPNPNKEMISLALGDPTVFGNYKLHSSCVEAVETQLKSFKANGYPPAAGYEFARAAIAEHHTTPTSQLTANDVVIASGCSGALELCINVLANEGQTILLPRPGFSVYQTIADSKGINCKYYNLIPEKSWEIDLAHLESLIDSTTAAILINNPSNPCGSVYTKQHVLDVLKVAEKHHIPIIADEIYSDMVFAPNQFFPLGSLSVNVPVLSVGGLAKKWLVPGWRLGWILIHDKHNAFSEIRVGLSKLAQIIIGANSLIQASLPSILLKTPSEFYSETKAQLQQQAQYSAKVLGEIQGLKIVVPQGAMYMMVGIDINQFKDIHNDIEFTEKLLSEESVMCLPGQCFKYPNYFRVVFTPPIPKLEEAYARIKQFCERHRK